MSMSIGDRKDGPCAAINVTPFADIMIVLLIIFMIATTAIGKDDRFRLPKAAHAREAAKSPMVVNMTRDGALLLGETRVLDADMLRMALQERIASAGAQLVQLQADDGLDYERVAPVLAAMRASGAEQIVLGTQPGVRTVRKP